MPQRPDQDTVKITLTLDREAYAYLKSRAPRRTGAGRVCSQILLEHKLRRELAAERQRGTAAPRTIARAVTPDEIDAILAKAARETAPRPAPRTRTRAASAHRREA